MVAIGQGQQGDKCNTDSTAHHLFFLVCFFANGRRWWGGGTAHIRGYGLCPSRPA